VAAFPHYFDTARKVMRTVEPGTVVSERAVFLSTPKPTRVNDL
jgi:hypothetical protein